MNLRQDTDLIELRHLRNEQGRSSMLKLEVEEWKTFTQVALIVLGLFILAKCEGHEIRVSPDKSDVVIHSWFWWGLSKSDTKIVWREDYWMAQDDKGNWHVAIEEPEYDPPD